MPALACPHMIMYLTRRKLYRDLREIVTMAASTHGHRATLLVLALATAAGLAPPLTSLRGAPTAYAAAPSRLRFSRVAMAAEEGGAKITIKKPGDVATSSSGTKVSVRVRPKGDKKKTTAAAPVVAAPADAGDVTTTVTVKAPSKVDMPAPPPAAPSLASDNLTKADELLLEGTTKANCSIMLQALQAGANPNVRDPKGRTPLHFVAGLGLAPAAVLLIHFGAQLDVCDGEDLRPVHMAAGYANAQTLRVLVAAGADVNVTGQRQGTPLQIVLQLGEYQFEQFMNRTAIQKRLKKKDEKLEKLKACVDIFDDIEACRKEADDWDEMLTEVLKTTGIPPPAELEAEPELAALPAD